MYKTRKNIEKLFIQSKKSDQIGSHIIGFDVLLKGGIDFHKIKSVFYQTINEYSVFKSLFRLSNKGLLRKYSNRLTSTFRIINCKKNRNNLQQIILSNSAKDIDPEKGRSISSSLYILNDNESVLSISASHLVVDAMSLEIVLKKILKNLELVSLKNNLDIISVSRNLESPSNFKLVPVLEVSSILNNSDKEKLESIGRNNNLSLFSLLLSTFGEFQSKYNYVGCLFSNRRKSQINEVDCFVQALPLYLPHNRNIILCAKEITSQIFSINKYIRSNDSIPEYEGFKAMFSMVVNPVIDLSSNSGLVMEYIRRLHTKPECDFHVYFYQFKDRIEVVFNYDPEKINREGTEDLLKRYIHYLKCFLSSKPKSEFHKNNDSQVIAAFHHIGVASWEFDIGKRRIEKRYSEMLQSNKVVDNQLNIEMAYYEKIGLELIAPINEKAPCNAFLKRDGEGPYHICWKVSDIDKTLSILDRGSIEYILIQKDGKSELFEESFICSNCEFLLIISVSF